jgi:hypothetical protein
MDAGLAVVLAAIGFFVLVPLWLAWLSTDSRRWGRVERVLGREPSGDPSELWGVWAGLSAANLASAAFRFLVPGSSGGSRWSALVWLIGGLLNAVVAGVLYRRRRRGRAGSADAEVQHGPEAGGPGAGGVGRH